MSDRFVKIGNRNATHLYTETDPVTGDLTWAFDTNGLVRFTGSVVIGSGATIIGGAWHPVVKYDEDNYIRRVFNSNLDGDWYLSFVIDGVETHRVGEFGLHLGGLLTELHYPTQETVTPRDSKHGEVEFDETNRIWKFAVPEDDTPQADMVKVSEWDSSGHARVHTWSEVGDRWRGSEGPLFVGLPYGWDPLPSINAMCMTSDMIHTHICFQRVTYAGAVNANMKVKEVSEGVSFT